MKLNHESYEKAFSNITLDDRIGMELVSNAKVKRLRKKKKITSQVAAAIICLVLAAPPRSVKKATATPVKT